MARKKMGRNKDQCKIYRTEGRREKNKVRKLFRTLKQQPNNEVVVEALKRLGVKDPRKEIRAS